MRLWCVFREKVYIHVPSQSVRKAYEKQIFTLKLCPPLHLCKESAFA